MQAVIVAVLACAAVASAGGVVGYSTGNYVQHAHALHATPAIAAAPAVAYGGLGLGAPAVYGGAYAVPAVAKTIAPVAQSTAFVNRAPAARIAVAAPVAVAHAAPVAYGGLAAAPVAYGGAYAASPLAYGGLAASPLAYGGLAASPVAYGGAIHGVGAPILG